MSDDEGVVKEILNEIKERMDGFESVNSSLTEGGLEEIHMKRECAVAYNVLDCLYLYIDDTWGE